MKAKTINYLCIAGVLFICACTTADDPSLKKIESEPFLEDATVKSEELDQSRRNTEIMFVEATKSIPLVIPLIYESDPGVFIMPVAFDSTMRVDCIYLVDHLNPDFICNRDIYKIDSLLYYVDDTERPYRVVVSRDNIHKTYIIDSFQFYEIRKINRKTYEFTANTTIPEVKIYSEASK